MEEETHQRMLDKTQEPSETDIIKFISDTDAIATWKQLQKYMKTHYDLLIETIYYGDKYGWLKRYRKSGRTILSLFPEKNSFSFLIVYGKKEIQKFSAQESEFLPAIIEIFRNTKKLHDGKWLWIRVTDSSYLESLKKLIAIKRKPKKPN
ncbi:MAG: DUF3788 domain-containing protein [Promethearchaeota archaeon]